MESRAASSVKKGIVAEMVASKEDGTLQSDPVFKRSARSETLFESSAKPVAEMDLDPVLEIKRSEPKLQVEIVSVEVSHDDSNISKGDKEDIKSPKQPKEDCTVSHLASESSVVEGEKSPSLKGTEETEEKETAASSNDNKVIRIVEKIVDEEQKELVVVAGGDEVEVSIFQHLCCGLTLTTVDSTTA
jgi:hypothetical protein